MQRAPIVAGQFYPSDKEELTSMIVSFAPLAAQPGKLRGCVAPHAGYVYSGRTAAAALATVDLPGRIIILCPNHTGEGSPLALWPTGSWRTPLGSVDVDEELGAQLLASFPLLTADVTAHHHEHAIEVLLPFLQLYVKPYVSLRITPIVLGTRQPEVILALGAVLAKTIAAHAPEALILASSDMNHYEDDATTRRKDEFAIAQMLAMNPAGLLEVTERERITMCGAAPAAAMLEASRRLGAQSCQLAHYSTSADAFGETRRCVGYAGLHVQ